MAKKTPDTAERKKTKAEKQAEEELQRKVMATLFERSRMQSRYEETLCADIYLRSGHRDHDLSPANPEGKDLRDAIEKLNATPKTMPLLRPPLAAASAALDRRLDRVLHGIKVTRDPSTRKDIGIDLGPLVPPDTPPNQVLRRQYRRLRKGQIPFVAHSVDGTSMVGGMCTVSTHPEALVSSGKSLARYLTALEHVALPQNKKVDFTFVLPGLALPQDDNEPGQPNEASDHEPTADDFLPLLGHGHKGDKKLAQLLTLLVHEYFDRELVDQANALKVLTVLCALPNPQSRAHVRFLTMGVNFEWDREAFTQDFAGATWKVVAPLIRHFASQEKELAELDDQAVLLPSLALIVKRLRDMKALQLGTLNERQVKFLRALAKYKAP